MKKFLQWVLGIAASLLAIFVVGGFLLPSKWHVEASEVINAPAEKIYEQVADLKNWQAWSPWTKEMDETQVYTYEGPESGVGAKWLWTSEKMGNGFLEITDAEVSKGIDYTLFIDMNNSPSTMKGAFHYVPEGNGQKVTWSDEGDSGNNLVKRWLSIVIKYMLAREFDAGLKKLKNLVEDKKVVEEVDLKEDNKLAEEKDVKEDKNPGEEKDAKEDKNPGEEKDVKEDKNPGEEK